MGGCLPMLLQMPILLAMYRLLDRMVELKGA
jgi:membrane protein insertase Oxa1/YidC/SpoIIIJ